MLSLVSQTGRSCCTPNSQNPGIAKIGVTLDRPTRSEGGMLTSCYRKPQQEEVTKFHSRMKLVTKLTFQQLSHILFRKVNREQGRKLQITLQQKIQQNISESTTQRRNVIIKVVMGEIRKSSSMNQQYDWGCQLPTANSGQLKTHFPFLFIFSSNVSEQ